jgi:hypothetical protein
VGQGLAGLVADSFDFHHELVDVLIKTPAQARLRRSIVFRRPGKIIGSFGMKGDDGHDSNRGAERYLRAIGMPAVVLRGKLLEEEVELAEGGSPL